MTAAKRRCLAPAKVNLYLHVTGRRADGYHLLDSLVAFVGVGDELSVAPADDLRLTVTGRYADAAGAGPDNLVLRAARGLAALAGVPARAALTLDKRLPVAAGLGGGSADAAATLHLLCGLWGVTPPAPALNELALSLGADVPVCLAGRPAQMAGIGEVLRPVALPPLHLLLVNPGVALPTPKVFGALAGRFSAAAPLAAPPVDTAGLIAALTERRNDLEPPAREVAPQIVPLLRQLAALPGVRLARMTGSGATCFAVFDSATAAAAATAQLARDEPGWWISHGPLLQNAWS